jgi:hypothetical protein
MRKFLKTFCAALLLAAGAHAQSPDPDAARIVTADIPRFWQAFDKASPGFAAEPFQKLYLTPGTSGLKDFVEARISGAEDLAKAVRKYPRYYASIRASTGRIAEMEKAIRASFHALKDLYPDAVFPDVYFLIGRLNSGGTTSDRGLLIGADMYGRTPETPEAELSDWLRQVIQPVEELPHIVAHELIHFEQKSPEAKTLLAMSIREGSADFLAELISGRHINAHVHAYANPREAELWREFQGRMHGKDAAGWLYSPAAGGRPQDLGYWMGYKIAKAYYDRAADKKQAIRDILEIKDYDAFLAKSGYAEKF